MAIAADAEATLPVLIEAVRALMTGARKTDFEARGASLAADRARLLDQARASAAQGWRGSAALANRAHGRLSVAIQNDGDLMYGSGVLWTAAHHRIPLLSVMHNNRAYHQETMHVVRMASRHQRGIAHAGIGTTLVDPPIDYAKLAQSMGVYGEGPITDPDALGPAIRRALAVVRRGEPALVDVVTQPR